MHVQLFLFPIMGVPSTAEHTYLAVLRIPIEVNGEVNGESHACACKQERGVRRPQFSRPQIPEVENGMWIAHTISIL